MKSISVVVGYCPMASKNDCHYLDKRGLMRLRPQAKNWQSEIELLVRNRVILDGPLQPPVHIHFEITCGPRGRLLDGHNIYDLGIDSVCRGLGIDDSSKNVTVTNNVKRGKPQEIEITIVEIREERVNV